MSIEQYEPRLAPAARRAISTKLPSDVAFAAVEFINGPLGENPYRVGKELNEPLDGIYSARLMREWRILYTVEEKEKTVTVRDIRHRRDAYRAR